MEGTGEHETAGGWRAVIRLCHAQQQEFSRAVTRRFRPTLSPVARVMRGGFAHGTRGARRSALRGAAVSAACGKRPRDGAASARRAGRKDKALARMTMPKVSEGH